MFFKKLSGNIAKIKKAEKLFLINLFIDGIYILFVMGMFVSFSRRNNVGIIRTVLLEVFLLAFASFFIYNRIKYYSEKKILSFYNRVVVSIFLIAIRIMFMCLSLLIIDNYFGIYTFTAFYYVIGGTSLEVFNNKKEYRKLMIFIILIFLLKSINLTNLGLLLTVLSIFISTLDTKYLDDIYKEKNNEFNIKLLLNDKITYIFYIFIFYISILLSESNKAIFKEFLKGLYIKDLTIYEIIQYFLGDFANPVYKSIVFGIILFITKDLFDIIKNMIFNDRYRKYKHNKIYVKTKTINGKVIKKIKTSRKSEDE